MVPLRSSLLLLAPLASALLALPGCEQEEEGDGKTNFALEVVLESQGKAPAPTCTLAGNSTGGSSYAKFGGRPYVEIAAFEDETGTWYEVHVNSARDWPLGTWRYDEAMARAGAVLAADARDGDEVHRVRIRGSFEPIDDCGATE